MTDNKKHSRAKCDICNEKAFTKYKDDKWYCEYHYNDILKNEKELSGTEQEDCSGSSPLNKASIRPANSSEMPRRLFLVLTDNISDYIKVQDFDVNNNDIVVKELTPDTEQKIIEILKKENSKTFEHEVEYKTVTPMTLSVITEMTIEKVFQKLRDLK